MFMSVKLESHPYQVVHVHSVNVLCDESLVLFLTTLSF
jgi:hypothetical protein